MNLVTSPQRWLIVLGVALVGLYAGTLAWAFETQSYNVWGSMIVAPLVGAVNIILLWRVSKREDDPWMVGLMGLGLVLKLFGSLARYFTVFVLYNGAGDAASYNRYASYQHVLWRQGYVVWEADGKMGTQNLELITTAVYTIIGPAPLAGFLIFASFAYWGVYLLYRAFRIAVPGGHHRLYAALVFLLPSLLFWPSSIGKEAWLMLWLGVLVLGAAKFFTHQPWAFTLMILGAMGTSLIRPHITVLLVASLLVAQLFRPAGDQAINVLSKAAGIAVLGVAAAILTTQSADFLGIEDLTTQAVTDSIGWASGQTGMGGSAFTPVPLTNPLGVPAAIATLLVRPFPWEARGVTMLAQSVEGLALIALFVKFRSRLVRVPRLLIKNPFVAFAAIYSLVFILAFSGFSNFGIVARQRTLMLPLFLVLLALPLAPSAVTTVRRGRVRARV